MAIFQHRLISPESGSRGRAATRRVAGKFEMWGMLQSKDSSHHSMLSQQIQTTERIVTTVFSVDIGLYCSYTLYA
ncbi:MAG: hypothetical protein M2R45_02978 [Verrucomicrobia subdivision 3 bacterium]|nr:hypothetical protein [Limisphaerales bacterium]MCS1416535.1 hypothetical protein [Limisphaerales bacterium]